jgi:arylsulfatase B
MVFQCHCLLFVVASIGRGGRITPKPHIIHILADDLGWAEVGYHRSQADKADVSTPNLDMLVGSEALELTRHYVHKICSPSRCALQTGRAPIHVNVQNVAPEVYNLLDQEGGYQGIPLDMTGVAEHLAGAGYSECTPSRDTGVWLCVHGVCARVHAWSFPQYFHGVIIH